MDTTKLYSALHDLTSQTNDALGFDAAPLDAAPTWSESPPINTGGSYTLKHAYAQLSAARESADALARAEARLDLELVRRVLSLASVVLATRDDTLDKAELRRAMKAFGEAVRGLREQYEPPHGSQVIPLPYGFDEGAVTSLAARPTVDRGIVAASDALEKLRVLATARAVQIADRIQIANDRNRAIFGEVSQPRQPKMVYSLTERLDGMSTPHIDDVRYDFDSNYLGETGYSALRDGVMQVVGNVEEAKTRAGNLS